VRLCVWYRLTTCLLRGAQATDLLASGNRWLGKSTNMIDANVEIWRFF